MEYFIYHLMGMVILLTANYLYYAWAALPLALLPLFVYGIGKLRKRIRVTRARARLLEEDFIP